VPIYKKKDKIDCGNNRGISLLSHIKIFTSILMERLEKRTKEIPSEEQADSVADPGFVIEEG